MSVKSVFQRHEIHSAKWDAVVRRQCETNEDTPRVPSILLAEEDDEYRGILAQKLRDSGYRVTVCGDRSELADHFDGYVDEEDPHAPGERFDLIISDVQMPGVFGLSVVQGAEQCIALPPTILITAFPDGEVCGIAKRCGVLAVFSRPFEIDDLLKIVRQELGSVPH